MILNKIHQLCIIGKPDKRDQYRKIFLLQVHISQQQEKYLTGKSIMHVSVLGVSMLNQKVNSF